MSRRRRSGSRSSTLAMMVVVMFAAMLLLVDGYYVPCEAAPHDAAVKELREQWQAAKPGEPLPIPPVSLGEHSPCIKYGLSCSSAYVDFLKSKLSGASERLRREEMREDLPRCSDVPAAPPLPSVNDADTPMNDEAMMIARGEIANLRRWRDILQRNLSQHKAATVNRDWMEWVASRLCGYEDAPSCVWHVVEASWINSWCWSVTAAMDWRHTITQIALFSLLAGVIVWIGFDDDISPEHQEIILNDSPTYDPPCRLALLEEYESTRMIYFVHNLHMALGFTVIAFLCFTVYSIIFSNATASYSLLKLLFPTPLTALWELYTYYPFLLTSFTTAGSCFRAYMAMSTERERAARVHERILTREHR